MKPFRFQKFNVLQSPEVFAVGTDAVLLGALANGKKAKTALEVGSGTGIVSLMLAQRFPEIKILAVDIDERSAFLTKENFNNSPFSTRLDTQCVDFKIYAPEKCFDIIFSNPPYFEPNASEKSITARQKRSLTFEDLLVKSSEMLCENGQLSIIIPKEYQDELVSLAAKRNLCLIRQVNVRGIYNGKIRRVILEFANIKQNTQPETIDFVIEKSPRQYSDQYLELTKEFHVF